MRPTADLHHGLRGFRNAPCCAWAIASPHFFGSRRGSRGRAPRTPRRTAGRPPGLLAPPSPPRRPCPGRAAPRPAGRAPVELGIELQGLAERGFRFRRPAGGAAAPRRARRGRAALFAPAWTAFSAVASARRLPRWRGPGRAPARPGRRAVGLRPSTASWACVSASGPEPRLRSMAGQGRERLAPDLRRARPRTAPPPWPRWPAASSARPAFSGCARARPRPPAGSPGSRPSASS